MCLALAGDLVLCKASGQYGLLEWPDPQYGVCELTRGNVYLFIGAAQQDRPRLLCRGVQAGRGARFELLWVGLSEMQLYGAKNKSGH